MMILNLTDRKKLLLKILKKVQRIFSLNAKLCVIKQAQVQVSYFLNSKICFMFSKEKR